MATTKTTRGSADGKSGNKKLRKKEVRESKFRLPLDPIEPISDFDQVSVLIYGERKIGKTTLAMQGPGRTLLIQFDRAQDSYRRLEEMIPDWAKFRTVLCALERAVANGNFPYSRVVVDGADIWYNQCQQWVCEKFAIEHPSDEGWGKAWNKLRDTFTDAVLRMERLPCGRWYICHADWTERKDHKGRKITRLQPKLTNRADEILNSRVGLWVAYDYDGPRRVMYVRGTEDIGAGHSLDDPSAGVFHFRTPDDIPLDCIRAGKSAEIAYKRLVDGYNNEYEPPKKDGKKRKLRRKV